MAKNQLTKNLRIKKALYPDFKNGCACIKKRVIDKGNVLHRISSIINFMLS